MNWNLKDINSKYQRLFILKMREMPGSRLYSSYSCFVGILERDRKFYVDYAKVINLQSFNRHDFKETVL